MHVLLIHQLFATGDEAGGTRHFEIARRWTAAGDRVTVLTSPANYLTGASTPAPEGLPDGLTVVRTGLGASASGSKPGTDGASAPRGNGASAPPQSPTFAGRVAGFARFALAAFRAGLRVRGVDVVWGTTPPIFQAPAAWAVARLKGAPFLLEVRDLWPDFAVALGVLRMPMAIRAAKALERFLYRRADLVVVNSPGFVDHVRREGGREPVVVPNGVDPAPFLSADRAAWRRKLGWEGKFVILYAGAHGVPNDLEVVLRAARAQARAAGTADAADQSVEHATPGTSDRPVGHATPDASDRSEEHTTRARRPARQPAPQPELFAFVGSGRDLTRLRRLAEEWKLANVRFMGPRPKSEMPGILAAADCCVAILKAVPMFATTYPNKVFDYMAAGRPVALAIDGAIRQVVESAGAGLFARPGDPAALLEVVQKYRADPARAARDGKAGQAAVAARFHRDDQARRLRDAVAGLLAPEAPS